MAMLILISLPLGPLCYAYCYQVHCFFPLLFEIIWYLSFSLTSQSPSRTGQGRWCKYLYILLLFVVQSLSQVWLFVTPWTAACQASLSFTISQSLLKLMSIESVMLSNHLILCHPLLLLPSIVSQHQGLFQWVGSSHQVAKILKLQQQSFNEHSGLISAASVLLLKF